MRRSITVITMLVAIFAWVFAGASHADEDGEVLLLALVDDADGDGITDAEDNCVDVPNEDQADFDGDVVGHVCDNCSEAVNPAQDDTDNDYCGNLCDCDYNQDGRCGRADFGIYSQCYGRIGCPSQQHVEPVSPDRTVGFPDCGFFVAHFGSIPGPSGTTPGTVSLDRECSRLFDRERVQRCARAA